MLEQDGLHYARQICDLSRFAEDAEDVVELFLGEAATFGLLADENLTLLFDILRADFLADKVDVFVLEHESLEDLVDGFGDFTLVGELGDQIISQDQLLLYVQTLHGAREILCVARAIKSHHCFRIFWRNDS